MDKDINDSDEMSIEEEEAESIDSGCVADGPVFEWKNVSQALQNEYKFVLGVLEQHLKQNIPVSFSPDFQKQNLEQTETTNSMNVAQINTAVASGSSFQVKGKMFSPKVARSAKKAKRSVKEEKFTNKRLKPNKDPITKPVLNHTSKHKIYNQEGKLVFNKFDFSNTSKDEEWLVKKQKNLNNVLNKVLKEKEEVKKLAVEGKADVAANMVIEKGWANAMKKTQGLKVKDDPELIRKSVKKRENQKHKSKKDWEQRSQQQKNRQGLKQEQRKRHLNTRKQRKIDLKMKRMKKKGHFVPGF